MVGLLDRILNGSSGTGGLLGYASSPQGMGMAQGLLTGNGNFANNVGVGVGLGQANALNQAKIDSTKAKGMDAKSTIGKLQQDYASGLINKDTYEAGLFKETAVTDGLGGYVSGGIRPASNQAPILNNFNSNENNSQVQSEVGIDENGNPVDSVTGLPVGGLNPSIANSVYGQKKIFDKELSAQSDPKKNLISANGEIIDVRTGEKKFGKRTYDNNEALSAGFANRAAAADAQAAEIEASGFDPASLSNLPDSQSNLIASSAYQTYDQTKLDFVTAVLRKESGAAITPEEYAEEKKYYPRFGDDAAVRVQKAASRKRAIENLKAQSQGAYDQFFGNKNTPAPTSQGLADPLGIR